MKEKRTYVPVALKVKQFDESDVITASNTGTSSWINFTDDCTHDDIFS